MSGPGPPTRQDKPVDCGQQPAQAALGTREGSSLHHPGQREPPADSGRDTIEDRQRRRDEEMRERQRRRKPDIQDIRRVKKDDDYDSSEEEAGADSSEDSSGTRTGSEGTHHDPRNQATEAAPNDVTKEVPMDAQPIPGEEDNGEFTTVKGKRRVSQKAARARVEEKRKRLQFEISNQYDSLTDIEADGPPPKKPATKRSAEVKAPALFLKATNYIKLNYEIKQQLTGGLRATFLGDHIKYQVDNMADYRTVFKFCQDKNIPFFTHQQADKREKKIVIKGLPPEAEEEDIKRDLERQGFRVTMVYQYKKRDEDSKRLKDTATYTASLPKDQKWENIYQVRYILLTKVTIEDYENRQGPPQCKRCLRWGHTANYCWMPARCIRCGDYHERKDCRLKDSEPARCAGCKGAHPASWRGCSEYQKALRNYKPSPPKSSSQKTTRHPSATSAPRVVMAGPSTIQPEQGVRAGPSRVREARSFADAAAGREQETPRIYTKPTVWDMAAKFLNVFFSEDITTKIISIGKRFAEAPDIMAKMWVLVDAASLLFA